MCVCVCVCVCVWVCVCVCVTWRQNSNWEALGSLEERSVVQPAPGQALSVKHRKKRKLKGKGAGPAGVVGIPVASSLAGRVGALPPEA